MSSTCRVCALIPMSHVVRSRISSRLCPQLAVFYHACGGLTNRAALLNATLGGAAGYIEHPKKAERRMTSRLNGRLVPFRVMPFPLVESVYSIHSGCWPIPQPGLNPKYTCKQLNSTWFC